jgi:hypothetical protein
MTLPPILRHTVSVNSNEVQIFGRTNILDDYFSGIEPDELVTPNATQQSVNGHKRNRYPGDAGFNVGGHLRDRSNIPTKGGNTLPGFRFWCERPTGTGNGRRSNARQFNYSGNWQDLVQFAEDNSFGSEYTLRNSSGRSVQIGA